MRLEPRARVGEVLDAKYCIEEFLGGGAMGNVFRARHVKVGRSFAIKMLHERLRGDPKIAMRFAREAEIAAQLRHPNVVGVLDVCEVGNEAFMVMEFAPGRTLTELIRASAPFARDRAIAIIRQVLDGLEHAHGFGLVHRDLKPDNIIVEHTGEREHVRIVDFGIAILRESAASRDASGRITTGGLVLGTPQYMAPEQATGRGFDQRADLFALGVICFEMLTGRMPFEGSGVDVALANVNHATPPMGVRVPTVQVDPLLESFTRKLMGKRPDERFPTAGEARRVLELIDSDPKAAALETVALPRKPSSSNSPVQMAPTEHVPQVTPEQIVALGSAKTQAIDTVERPVVRQSRVLAIGGTAAVAVLLASLTIAGRWSQRPRTRVAAREHAAAMHPAAAVTRTPTPTPAVVEPAVAEPAVVAEPAGAEPAAAPTPEPKPSAKKPRVAKAKPAKAETAAPAEVTAKDVAALYAVVGRKLKSAATKPGVDDLRKRYLEIKIQTQLATVEDRQRTQHTLAELATAIDRL